MSALLALLSSLLWGSSDYLGGVTARRLPVVLLLAIGQSCAVVVLVIVTSATGAWRGGDVIGWGLAAGVVGPVALTAFYTALSQGTMGVVAPIASCGVLVPIVVGLARGETPGAVRSAGIAVTVGGIVLAARAVGHPDHPPAGKRAAALALVAAAGFGAVLLFVAEGSATSALTVLSVQRLTNVTVVLLALLVLLAAGRVSLTALPRPVIAAAALTGLGDVGANTTYAFAVRGGLLSVTAVLASLYPVVTALLARRINAERLSRAQLVGVGTTLAGVVLLAAG